MLCYSEIQHADEYFPIPVHDLKSIAIVAIPRVGSSSIRNESKSNARNHRNVDLTDIYIDDGSHR